MRVAFIGLGKMGAGMAGNIARRGFDLTVWNRTPEKMTPLLAQGAQGAASAKAAAEGKDIVVTSLMDDRSISDALKGDEGILAGLKEGAIHLCVTTISPKFASELAHIHSSHGSRYVSGPVVGRPDAAAAGQLVSYLAGEPAAVAAVKPVAETFSRAVTIVGQNPSAANSIKLCMNYSIAALIELIGEAYAFAEKSRVDPALLREFYEGAFAHPGLKLYARQIFARDFSAAGGFAMSAGRKDVRLMLDAAAETGAPLAIAQIIETKMDTAIAAGMAERDWSATYEITRREAGLA